MPLFVNCVSQDGLGRWFGYSFVSQGSAPLEAIYISLYTMICSSPKGRALSSHSMCLVEGWEWNLYFLERRLCAEVIE